MMKTNAISVLPFTSTAARYRATTVCIAAITALLAGCGGGGGGGVGEGVIVVPPTTTPAPMPPPPPPPPPASKLPPPPFGLRADQPFSVFGWINRSETVVEPTTAEALRFQWSASATTYLVALPDTRVGQLEYSFPGMNPAAFQLMSFNDVPLDRGMTVDPYGRYSGIAFWYPSSGGFPSGSFAFGIATATGDVPLGRRSYRLDERYGGVGGELVFDAQAASITGTFEVAYSDAWGPWDPVRYTLNPTPYEAGSTGFSATFDVPGAPSGGEIEGSFTGPQAAELILRWKAPVMNPYDGKWFIFHGILFGRLQ